MKLSPTARHTCLHRAFPREDKQKDKEARWRVQEPGTETLRSWIQWALTDPQAPSHCSVCVWGWRGFTSHLPASETCRIAV